ncbi:type VI secretion system amidase effector protein Tae4 [Variovorax sp. YR216]|uniref:type VI secretion system amidase effector protein Tae4 n=1 Tax=Variovorax sp. YR216 TaxID=1882828 RepID=UPI000896FAE3|nr:type VI secretion system amidase effector protein Tae4 [Variovorax sp. YR216]SEB00995.1 Type VI secretion system (T6SS), amidase effector protein 4 [Variovorax sp. YR216]
MTIVKFSDLWKNHPHVTGEGPVLDKKVYNDQCAINLAVALIRSGMNLDGFKGTRSWQQDRPKYPIRAQELADWLARTPTGIPFGPKRFKGNEIENKESGESVFDRIPLSVSTGIVFFQNYWGSGRQGDHIDLWNSRRLTDVSSWLRLRYRISWEGYWSNYLKSESIWFWPIP